jgi:4-diphosphocytidyl-2-C-methyl-D-erythritol kinase
MTAVLVERAPAKVNLTLSVLGRRPDGYHELDSLVVFADVADQLSFEPAESLELAVVGPGADACGPADANLVIKAARLLADGIEGFRLGRFRLEKDLPVAAGLGGGSSDAAAALRLLARENGIALDDRRLAAVARATGADVPVCLQPHVRTMRGIGDLLSAPIELPRLPAVLVNPRVAVPTAPVFAALGLRAGDTARAAAAPAAGDIPGQPDRLLAFLQGRPNDLEAPAISIQPVVGQVLAALRDTAGVRLVRMSGSGATCFGLYGSSDEATAAARALQAAHPAWWVRATVLGDG